LSKLLHLMIIFIMLYALLCTESTYAAPRENQIEDALLQQLHYTIVSSLQNIYKEQISQYRNEHIISINERVTTTNKQKNTQPVDAIHGQKYFEITVGLVRPNGEYVVLNLKNDTAAAQYYLVSYKKGYPKR
jgi:hypothetical protein